MNYTGIPSELTLKRACEWVKPLVSKKRFDHIEGTARVARKLAKEAGSDTYLAQLAAWLHDACKEVKDKKLVEMAKAYGLTVHPVEEVSGYLLHGPVGAQFAKESLNLTNQQLLDAISEHTLGAVHMTELSKIVFLADCLEESRPADYTDPIWLALEKGFPFGQERLALKDQSISIDLDAAVLVALNSGLEQLLESNRLIHPKTVDVRNAFLKVIKSRL